MPDLILSEREQTALRELYACSPVPGRPMPPIEVFDLVDRLVPGDVMGACLADDQGHVLDEVVHTRRDYDSSHLEDMTGETGPLYLGIVHWSANPAAAAACNALPYGHKDGVSIGVRNGVACVSQLFMDREKRMYSERDLAMLRLITPALQRLLRERATPSFRAPSPCKNGACWWRWPQGGRTPRSRQTCSSRPARCASTSRTASASSG